MNAGSVDAFHVGGPRGDLAGAQDPAQVSRLMAAVTFCLTRCSASSLRLQVADAVIFQSAGDVRDVPLGVWVSNQ